MFVRQFEFSNSSSKVLILSSISLDSSEKLVEQEFLVLDLMGL